MGTIYTGVASAWKVPGVYVNVQLGRGVPSAAGSPRRVLIVGSKLNEADPIIAAENEVLFELNPRTGNHEPLKADGAICAVESLSNAGKYFGYGSELYTMAKAAFAANASTNLWAYVISEPAGGTRASSQTIAIANATEDDTIKVSCLGEQISVPVSEGDTAVDIATDIADVFNARLKHLPYLCYADAGTLSFRAKHLGAIWNGALAQGAGGLERIGVQVTIQSSTGGVVFDANAVTIGYGTGSTVGAGEHQIDFEELKRQRFHYVVMPCDSDGTTHILTSGLTSYLADQADPKVGLRQQAVFGSTAALNVVSGLTHPDDGVSDPRIQCVWAKGNSYTPGQLAAAVAAVRAAEEEVDPAVNLCRKRLRGVPMTSDDNLVNLVSQNAAISDGITPLVPFQGDMVILRSVTCSANRPVAPVLDTGKVTVSDFVADDIELKMLTSYTGFKLSPDTDAPLPSNVVTPSAVRLSILNWLRRLEAKGIITRVTELSEKVRVEIDPDVDGRINFEIPEDVVDILAVAAGNLIQVG